jgi:heavy metal sensor kinase
VEEKHFDLDSFEPGMIYQTEDELIWDIIYDAIVFNRRNTFIEIVSLKKIVFKTANLAKNELTFDDIKEKEAVFDFQNDELSEDIIRACQLRGKRYTVIVAYPKEYIVQTLNSLRDIYIKIAPLFLIISMIGGALLSSKSLSRIDAIIKKTEEITAQNLDEIILGGEYHDEYGRLVSKMNEMIQRIKKSVDYMNQFSISAAHELKTPLTILRGEIEIILRSPKTPEQYIEVLKSNFEETIRMIKIVDNLFFISKSDNALINIDKRTIKIHSFLSSIVSNMKILGQEKNMDLVLTDCPLLEVNLDTELIKQALSNVVDNAFKYGDENTIVEINALAEGESVRINVSNVGEKIPAAEIDKIFDRFYRSDSSRARKTGGIGLGLSVVKSIVNLHKGSVEVSSNTDSVTTVSIYLPKA